MSVEYRHGLVFRDENKDTETGTTVCARERHDDLLGPQKNAELSPTLLRPIPRPCGVEEVRRGSRPSTCFRLWRGVVASLVPSRNGGAYQARLKGEKVQVPGFEPGPLAFIPLHF